MSFFSASKPPTGQGQQPFKGKLGSAQGSSAYTLQRQSSRVREKLNQKLFFLLFF